MLNKEECKKILHRKGNTFTDEEIEKIREHLYKMARIIIEQNTKPKTNEK